MTLGAAALGRVAIASGLVEGDVIALVDPEARPAAAPSPAPGVSRRRGLVSFRESLLRALASLSAHKLRSALTMLGMIFGVGAVIAMLSIGAGAERQALEMIRRMGISNLLVRAKEFRPDELQEVRKKSIGVSLRDAAGIEEAVPGVAFTGPRVKVNPWSVRARGGKSEAKVSGVSYRHAELVALPLAAGRFLTKADEERHAQVCVLGDGARRDLFGWDPALGRELKVNDVWFTVVGVLAPSGESGDTFQGSPSARPPTRSSSPTRRSCASSTATRSNRPSPSSSSGSTTGPRPPRRPGSRRPSSTASTAAPPTSSSSSPRRSSRRAARPSASSTSSWGASPGSRSSSAASGS